MIYLIGGAPRVGKSLVAKRIAEEVNAEFFSADVLDENYASVMPEVERWEKFPMPGFSGEQSENTLTPEQRVELQIISAKSLEPELSRVVSEAFERGETIVIEGVQLTPEYVFGVMNKIGADRIRSIFIGSEDAESIFLGITMNTNPDNWLSGSDPRVIRQVAEFAAAMSSKVKEECRKYGLQYFARTKDFETDVNDICSLVVKSDGDRRNPFKAKKLKNVYIFEGVASSGKTTLEKLLAERLGDVVIISEGETLMPIIENTDRDVGLAHLRRQLDEIRESPESNVIVDRFHLTHAFRTRSPIEGFSVIEEELRKIGKVTVILLIIDPEKIQERIEETVRRREDGWKKGKQGSIEEKVEYYLKQQDVLKGFAATSGLQSVIIDTTQKNWEAYVEIILKQFTN